MNIRLIGVDRISNILQEIIRNNNLNISRNLDFNLLYINFGLYIFSKKNFLLLIYSLFTSKPILIHWIGSDIHELLNNSIKTKFRVFFLKLITSLFKITHWSAALHIKEELKSLGIKSETVFLPTELIKLHNIEKFPTVNSFLSYIPEQREEFYGLSKILYIADKYPEIHFDIVANKGKKENLRKNVTYHGWVNEEKMDKLYKENKGVIRIPKHDALGGTVLEAVIRGRYAIWTYNAKYVYQAFSIDQVEEAVLEISAINDENYAGAEYVNKKYNYEKLSLILIEKLAKFTKL